MAICCDTSFLFSLYGRDAFTSQAVSEAGRLQGAVSVSILNEFEWENSIHLSVFRKVLSLADAAIMTADYAKDMRLGRLSLANCDLGSVLVEAKRLSLAHTQREGQRAFDILHVAVALQLGAREFLSFDVNQRKLAKAEGLKVRPV